MDFTIVSDRYFECPRCGAYAGHPDPSLDFPNRNKVDHYGSCFNPNCTCAYFDPETGEVVEDKLSPEEAAASHARVKADVDAMFAERGPMVRLDDGSRPGIESWGWK